MKKMLRWIVVVGSLLLAGYGGYKLYNLILQDVEQRIRASVAAGAAKGISRAINPVNWVKKAVTFPFKLFGKSKDHKKDQDQAPEQQPANTAQEKQDQKKE